MGLDMYLESRHYVKHWDHISADKQFKVTVTRGGKPFTAIDPKRVKYVTEEVAYWRKANAIHAWFVRSVQRGEDDCREYPVSLNQLRELLSLVDDVLTGRKQPTDALPTQSGFFFGSTDYDEDYRQDLEDTKAQLTPLVNSGDQEAEYYYNASW